MRQERGACTASQVPHAEVLIIWHGEPASVRRERTWPDSFPDVKKVANLETRHFIAEVCFSPTGDELTVINRAGVEWWDTATWRLKRSQPGTPVSGSYVLYTPDGAGLWKVTNFRDTGLYDRHTLEPVLPLPPNVVPLALSSDGRQLAVSVDDQRVQVWNLAELRAQLRQLGLDWGESP